MRRLADFSIRGKLLSMSVLSSGMALLLACVAFLAYELVTFRHSMVQTLGTQAEMLGYNITAPLLFNDADAAGSILEALRANDHILAAGIFDRDGRLFARYPHRGQGQPDVPTLPEREPEGYRFDSGRLVLYRQILSAGRPVGRLYIASDLRELDERVVRYAGIAGLVLAVSFVVALVISSRLQRSISQPVFALAQTAKTVTLEKNYSARAASGNRDELGLLVESFNEMLSQIQVRDDALQQARNDLERRVEERTHDLERQAQELARSNADLEQFAYVASHDLQEPLRMVGSYTQLLARRYRGKLDADADEFIGYAVDGVSRMQTLINDLLTYSRVGTKGHEFAPTNCEKVLDEALQNLQASIFETGARVVHGPLPTVFGDATQLAQLFQNLIANAIKFHGETPPQLDISARRNGRDWKFAFADNGIGIDPQYRERIFVIFQRLHGRTQYPGTGIGLAICKKIVERHGGTIWVESQLGRGSTFCFTVPITKGKAS